MYIGKCLICHRIFVSSYISHYRKKHNLTIQEISIQKDEIVKMIYTETRGSGNIQGII